MNTTEVFIITPKRAHREKLLPLLAGMLESIEGVHVLGLGTTCIKVQVAPASEFQVALSEEIRNSCFIERAAVFDLAAKR